MAEPMTPKSAAASLMGGAMGQISGQDKGFAAGVMGPQNDGMAIKAAVENQPHQAGKNMAVDRAMNRYWRSQNTKESMDKFVQGEAKDLGIPVQELVRQLGPGFVDHYRHLPGRGKLVPMGDAAYQGMADKVSEQGPAMTGQDMQVWGRQ